MRAITVQQFGGPQVLTPTEIEDVAPRPGEVLIRTRYADVMYLDTQLRAGWGQDFFDLTLPYVPGGAVGGEIVAVGAGVDLVTATAIVHDGQTAQALLRSAAVRPGETVLVTAAGGGVGVLLVQLLRAAGATSQAAANEAYRRAEQLLAQDPPSVPLWYASTPVGWSNRVTDVKVTLFGTLDLSSIRVK